MIERGESKGAVKTGYSKRSIEIGQDYLPETVCGHCIHECGKHCVWNWGYRELFRGDLVKTIMMRRES